MVSNDRTTVNIKLSRHIVNNSEVRETSQNTPKNGALYVALILLKRIYQSHMTIHVEAYRFHQVEEGEKL